MWFVGRGNEKQHVTAWCTNILALTYFLIKSSQVGKPKTPKFVAALLLFQRGSCFSRSCCFNTFLSQCCFIHMRLNKAKWQKCGVNHFRGNFAYYGKLVKWALKKKFHLFIHSDRMISSAHSLSYFILLHIMLFFHSLRSVQIIIIIVIIIILLTFWPYIQCVIFVFFLVSHDWLFVFYWFKWH